MKDKPHIERLREAWRNAPDGAKTRVFEVFGHSQQKVSHILEHGRKNESIVLSVLYAIKQASADVVKDAYKKNNKVQKI